MARNSVEASLFSIVQELGKVFGEERVMGVVNNVVKSAATAKANIDSNVDTVLWLANLPTRGDFTRLDTKLETIERTLINLTRKVDKLADQVAAQAAGAESPARHRPTPHATPKPKNLG